MDLFCGPGRYEGDGAESTPLHIVRAILKEPILAERTMTLFNDQDPESVRRLITNLQAVDGAESLAFAPEVENYKVGQEVVQKLQQDANLPLLLFADPWGYKGLSLKLINMAIQGFGSECIFFFNYKRINAALSNSVPGFREHMVDIFGEERVDRLQRDLIGLKPTEREAAIVATLKQALREDTPAEFIRMFRFPVEGMRRTSHYIVHVTKNIRGYEIMSEIMANAGARDESGLPLFEHRQQNPADNIATTLPLFKEKTSLDKLADELAEKYVGQQIQVDELINNEMPKSELLRRNYKEALKLLESSDRLVVVSGRVQENKMPERAIVRFRKR